MPLKCSKCQTDIEAGQEVRHQSNLFCQDCYLEIRSTRKRKTHWQYLKSVKTDYLIPAKDD